MADHARYFATLLTLALAACGTTPVDDSTHVPADPVEPTEPTNPGEPGDPVEPTDPVDPADPVDPVDPIEPGLAPLGCDEPHQQWFAEQNNWWIDTAWLGVVGDGRFVSHSHHANGGDQLLRASDGEPAGGLMIGRPLDFSADQERVAYWRDDAVVVAEVAGNATLREFPTPGGSWQAHRVELSPDGEWIAMARCSDDGEGLEIEAVSVSTDQNWSWNLSANESQFCPGWASHNALEIDIAGGFVAVAEPQSGVVWLHSLADGSARAIEAHPSEREADDQWWNGQPILDLALSPDGGELATSGWDDTVRRWRTSDLALIDERPAGWVVLNLMTYTTPFATSPLAYSHDGRALAYLTDEGRAGIIDTASGQTTLTIESASEEPPDHWGGPEQNWGIAFFAFDPTDDALVVVETGGTQFFGCEREIEAPMTEPILRLTAPTEVRPGERWSFELEVESAGIWVGVSWALDEWALSPYFATTDPGWVFSEPGEHRVRFVADDGFHQVERELVVQVRD